MPQSETSSSICFDTLVIFLACACVALLFQRHAPEAYMDEPFHVNQTAQYCRGNFTAWDPKITTLPGLYLLGAPYGLAVHQALSLLRPRGGGPACGTAALRSMNVLLAAAFFAVFTMLYRQLHPAKPPEFATLMGAVALMLPTHFFYAFLYYTDVGGVTCVLACYLASLLNRHHLSAAAGALAVLFRQTNAVWVAFILGNDVLRAAAPDVPKLAALPVEQQLLRVLRSAWLHKQRLAGRLWSLAAVPALFAAFVARNGGIAVGDKGNHAPVLHLMQAAYLALFCAAALAPVHFSTARVRKAARQLRASLRRDAGRAVRFWGSLALLLGYGAHHYTLVHPFLLADNRHYTFYMWKDFLGAHPAAKFTLVPLYLYSAWSLWRSLAEQRVPALWALGLAGASAAALFPAWLIEFRYFTVPFMMLLLHMRPPSNLQAVLTLCLFGLVNMAAIYMFLYRPFKWPDGSIARFMF